MISPLHPRGERHARDRRESRFAFGGGIVSSNRYTSGVRRGESTTHDWPGLLLPRLVVPPPSDECILSYSLSLAPR